MVSHSNDSNSGGPVETNIEVENVPSIALRKTQCTVLGLTVTGQAEVLLQVLQVLEPGEFNQCGATL